MDRASESQIDLLRDFAARGQAAQSAVDAVTKAQSIARGPSKTPLINREHVRALILDLAKGRAHKWDRVSENTLVTANEMLRAWCVNHVARFPSKGKTL